MRRVLLFASFISSKKQQKALKTKFKKVERISPTIMREVRLLKSFNRKQAIFKTQKREIHYAFFSHTQRVFYYAQILKVSLLK